MNWINETEIKETAKKTDTKTACDMTKMMKLKILSIIQNTNLSLTYKSEKKTIIPKHSYKNT